MHLLWCLFSLSTCYPTHPPALWPSEPLSLLPVKCPYSPLSYLYTYLFLLSLTLAYTTCFFPVDVSQPFSFLVFSLLFPFSGQLPHFYSTCFLCLPFYLLIFFPFILSCFFPLLLSCYSTSCGSRGRGCFREVTEEPEPCLLSIVCHTQPPYWPAPCSGDYQCPHFSL